MGKTTPHITGNETIVALLDKVPQSHDILSDWGLYCVGCHLGSFETLREGAAGHGIVGEEFERLLVDLNEAAKKEPVLDNPPVLTLKAKKQVLVFQEEQDKKGWGLKIDVIQQMGEPSYFLDFLEKPEPGDHVLTSRGIKLFVSPDSLNRLQNHQVDYVVMEEGEGFKVEKKK